MLQFNISRKSLSKTILMLVPVDISSSALFLFRAFRIPFHDSRILIAHHEHCRHSCNAIFDGRARLRRQFGGFVSRQS